MASKCHQPGSIVDFPQLPRLWTYYLLSQGLRSQLSSENKLTNKLTIMRAIWSGAISFGLVNIPVKLYSGTSAEHSLDLDMLSKKDMAPIRYARISTASNKEVEWKDIVKGYEVEKGKYVVITDEDFKKASPEKTNTIDIVQFSDEEEIDPMFYEKPYYLVPDKGAAKPYALLLKALEKVKKVAIATCVIRNREHIFSLKPLEGNLLLMEQMRYVDEIKERPEVK